MNYQKMSSVSIEAGVKRRAGVGAVRTETGKGGTSALKANVASESANG